MDEIDNISQRAVAQIFNLPYRGFAIRKRLEFLPTRLGCGRSAEYNSAIQQIKNLRYVVF